MIYLDNAATTFPKPEAVYMAMDHFARHSLANPGRAGHEMAMQSEHILQQTRHRLNLFFNGQSVDHWIFTLNGTDSLNLAFKGILKPGDHVITSVIEHNSVSRPLSALAEQGVITLDRVEVDEDGTIDPDDINRRILPNTRIIAINHASNVLGTVQPIDIIGKLASEKGILFLVDAAQTAGVIPIDVQKNSIDILAMPGHKGLFAPTGVGICYVKPGTVIKAWREGGTGGDSTTPTQPADFPYFLEGGTPNVLGIAGLLSGLEYLEKQTLATIHQHEIDLVATLALRLQEIPSCRIYGHQNWDKHVSTLSFTLEGLAAVEIGAILDQSFGIAIRPGLHCAPYIHKAMNTFPEGTVRVSPGFFNTLEEMDTFISAIREISF